MGFFICCIHMSYVVFLAPPKHTSASVSPSGDLLKGTAVNLTCSSDASPPVDRYIWFYNNGSITSHVGTGKDYIIGQGDREHNGDYYCEAKNKHGARNSTNQKLDFHCEYLFILYFYFITCYWITGH